MTAVVRAERAEKLEKCQVLRAVGVNRRRVGTASSWGPLRKLESPSDKAGDGKSVATRTRGLGTRVGSFAGLYERLDTELSSRRGCLPWRLAPVALKRRRGELAAGGGSFSLLVSSPGGRRWAIPRQFSCAAVFAEPSLTFPRLPRFACLATASRAPVGVSAVWQPVALRSCLAGVCPCCGDLPVGASQPSALFLSSHGVNRGLTRDVLRQAGTRWQCEDRKADLGISQQLWGGDNPL